MPAILALAEKYRLRVIEDCAIALGARWENTHVGLFGDVGCFSFYPVKHITTAEGGMFVSRHKPVADAVARLRAFGVDRTHTERAVPGVYEVPEIGLNYRMSELQAALGRAQMQRIEENLRMRRANFELLKSELAGIPLRVLDARHPQAKNSHYCLVAVFEEKLAKKRNDIVKKLNSAGIGTSIYYPQPVPRMAYYRKKYGYDEARFPEATKISDASVALPVGWHVSPEDVRYIATTLKQIVREEGA
jgi:dTDP-4-amino-4,6-dideoxygalactose transaminase